MVHFDQSLVRNLLLKQLPAAAFEALAKDMEAMSLPLKHEAVPPDTETTHVCFVERGLASIVATTSDSQEIEVGHIGPDGMTGAHILLKTDRTPNRTFIQVAGEGIAVPVSRLNAVLADSPVANDLLLRYVHCAELQLAHSALANGRYKMHERLARWLLMCHDRLGSDDLTLTHEFLSVMLGVRRSGITNELHIIEGMRVIKATRGNIRILSREGLEEIAGGSYGVPEREYERLIGVPLRVI
jgi:CRP-like cAMP-binding protein